MIFVPTSSNFVDVYMYKDVLVGNIYIREKLPFYLSYNSNEFYTIQDVKELVEYMENLKNEV